MLNGEECSICLEIINPEHKCNTECDHSFCKQCLDNWFDLNKLSCPLCRKNIKYFHHNGAMNRIICIPQKRVRAPLPPRNQPNVQTTNQIQSILVSKRLYYYLISVTFGSVCSMFAMSYLYSKCKASE